MTKPELPLCPFCGGTNTVFKSGSYDTRAVQCTDCFARSGYKATDADAIAEWNTRTDLSQALIAAAYEDAVLIALTSAGAGPSNAEMYAVKDASESIRSRTPTHAKEALDRIVREAVDRETAKLREACNQSRLAFAGYVSARSAIDMLDNLEPPQ